MQIDVEAFVRQEHPRVLRALTAYTGDREVALDATQEAMAIALSSPRKVFRAARPGAWLMRVAINEANQRYRRRAIEGRALQRLGIDDDVAAPDHDPTATPTLLGALSALPARQRAAVVLRHVTGLSVAETSIAMGCRPGTVQALTHQGLARLRQDQRVLALADADGETP